MTESQQSNQNDERHVWRRRAGNALMYDTMGATQMSLLTLFFGLRERHKLLEIGAGSLRASRFLIPYLNEGNYCGVEPNTDSVEMGIEHELGQEMARSRKPRFTAREDFGFHEFGETFDYALSYSVFTHVPPAHVPMIFENANKVFHDGSIMLATAYFADPEIISDPEKWTNVPINQYSEERLRDAAAASGLEFMRTGKIFQDWFVAFRPGNEAARKGAEAMQKVHWPSVSPKWEQPADWKN